jgi:hypothetical protein
MPEVPWYPQPPKAHLQWLSNQTARLWFRSPEDGNKVQVAVTIGDDNAATRDGLFPGENVWHLDLKVTVSPSIHFIDHFHSPNPVEFKLVGKDDL